MININNTVSLLAILVAVSLPALGQESDGKPGVLEEVVVTALKRGDLSLVEAAAGISTIGGDLIEDIGAGSLADFLQLSPGTTIDTVANSGALNIQIRGINTTFGSASVGFYMDDLPFSLVNVNLLPNPSPYDLDSVEVLKGPQGTLYGAGSSGGVVLVKTNDAVLNEFSAKFDLSASQTEDGGDSYSVSGAINIPLIEDYAAIRGVISYQDNSGWIDDALGTAVEDINASEDFNARIKALLKPSDRMYIEPLAVFSRKEDDLGNSAADDSAEIPISLFSSLGVSPFNQTDYDQYGLRISYEFDSFTLQNATGYVDWESQYETAFLSPLLTEFGATSWVNELRLRSNDNTDFSWVVGWYYRDSEQESFQDLIRAFGLPFNLDETASSEQYSVFGEGNLSLLDGRADISVGLSYFEDDTTTTSNLFGSLDVGSDRVTPQLTLAYHPSPSSTVYLRYAEGFRAATTDFAFSTFAAQAVDSTVDGLVDTEDTIAYEFGLKGEFFEGSLYGELMFFYNSIEDIQQSSAVFVPGLGAANTVINAGDATTQGVEWLISIEPTSGLNLSVSGAWTEAEIDEDFFSPGFLGGVVPLFEKGTRLNLVPELVVNGTASYQWSISESSGLNATASAIVQYASDRAVTVLGAPSIEGDDVTRVDLRLEIAREDWSAYVFAHNLTDESGMISGNALTGLYLSLGLPADGLHGSRYRPRTLGVGVRYRY